MNKVNLPMGLATEKGILTWGNVSATTNAVLRTAFRRATTFALDAKDMTFEAVHSAGIKVAAGKFGEIDRADIANFVSVVLGLYFAYISGLVFYRLYLQPFAKFPGYKICAACDWYEFYCYIIKGGQ
ncbi:uncharacterized protein J7T54_002688 [Emericellopsis cladophorae]|uniref:Uncharacterized protein n=1 Tax=Emericellopsis cladophorae TaxID=2686198 RepID=A0A9P9XU40_9HYPO|nr:uncharacterized protein J7T54_002688 [Emericellopsis cladophorae]KAI6777826.1 hypothetical protein J7T54_002688 [Emericellopsis cladophorae]